MDVQWGEILLRSLKKKKINNIKNFTLNIDDLI